MPTMPAISVIMPVRNGELWLGQSVTSVLSQDFSDFELLVVDDGSDDGTALILEKFSSADRRIRIIRQPPQGIVAALNRGFPFDVFAFPTVGMPRYEPIGPPIEPAVLYSIARQESGFNPKVVSTANALGLMQVTPEAARYVTGKFKAPFDQSRLLKDTVYNTQVGAAELGDVLRDYRGSYIMAFCGYNAGRGRVKEWIAKYGDPREPKVDPIDWVERIPISETRNYVQRVMENLQVYRVRFGGGTKLMIEADMRRGGSGGVH